MKKLKTLIILGVSVVSLSSCSEIYSEIYSDLEESYENCEQDSTCDDGKYYEESTDNDQENN